MLLVEVSPIAQQGPPGAQCMNVNGPTRMIHIPPRLFLGTILEDVRNLEVANRKQPGTHACIKIACIAAVKEPY